MGDMYSDSNRYYNFLQSTMNLNNSSEELSDNIESQINQYKQGKQESTLIGTELLSSTIPSAIPMIGDIYGKAQKIHGNLQEIKTQFGKVKDAMTTLPDDIKTLYGSKVDDINALLKNESSENILKAKNLYNELKNTVQKAGESGKSIASDSFTKMSDIADTTVTKAKSLVGDLTDKTKSFLNDTKSSITDLTSNTQDLIKNATVTSPEDINALKNSVRSMKSNLKQIGQQQADKIDAHIENIKNTVPVEQQGDLIADAENMKSQIGSQLKKSYADLKQSAIEKSQSNPEAYSDVIKQMNDPLELDSLAPMRELMGRTQQVGSEALSQAKSNVSNLAEQAKSNVSELGSQAKTASQELLSETSSNVKQAMLETTDATKSLVSNTTDQLANSAKNATDLVSENINKVSSVAEGFGKMSIEDLADVAGVSAIPVVGEVLGLAGLVGGAISGIVDLFSSHHSSAPKINLPSVPTMVYQAGL